MSAFPERPAVASGSPPDIDRILEAIRSEARARGSRGRMGGYSTEVAEPGLVRVASHGLPPPEIRHVADFLALPLDTFVTTAYREILGREVDAGGAAHYQRAVLRGALTRIEVLGRLRFSPEGRRRAAPLPGLGIAFALATGYRIPVLGPVAALLARLLAVPAFLQDRSAIEKAALATGSWMKR